MADTLQVEVAYAEPKRQKIIRIIANEGITAEQAASRSGIVRFFPGLDLTDAEYGIFSQPCEPDTVLRDGDRVEIYRPLIADPKEMRRQRANR
ncbi:RnfH family protein [Suttonella sp. R2A3]|uniref:RnfH family protein n=1 Tax=Suttonella sp. R2A3 TaxID=2908648 RepID=UPI001F435D01|nr:RnfH family protein [Suttonella sp. R2A3]UJF25060.1 RnfH family protein [Suttonella sp. R2A3]